MSKSRGLLQAFWENSLPRSLPCLHPFCLLCMSPVALIRNTNARRPSSRLQIVLTVLCAKFQVTEETSSIHTPAGLAHKAYVGVLLNRNFQELAVKADSKWMPLATSTHFHTPFPCLSWKRAQHSCSHDG